MQQRNGWAKNQGLFVDVKHQPPKYIAEIEPEKP